MAVKRWTEPCPYCGHLLVRPICGYCGGEGYIRLVAADPLQSQFDEWAANDPAAWAEVELTGVTNRDGIGNGT